MNIRYNNAHFEDSVSLRQQIANIILYVTTISFTPTYTIKYINYNRQKNIYLTNKLISVTKIEFIDKITHQKQNCLIKQREQHPLSQQKIKQNYNLMQIKLHTRSLVRICRTGVKQ